MSTARECRECGTLVSAAPRGRPRKDGIQRNARANPDKKFCCQPCAKAFANRATARGAQIYHLFRNIRRNRDEAAELGLWNAMCQIELAWEDEDRAAGRGSKSDRPTFKPASEELEYLLNVRDIRPTTNVGFARKSDP